MREIVKGTIGRAVQRERIKTLFATNTMALWSIEGVSGERAKDIYARIEHNLSMAKIKGV